MSSVPNDKVSNALDGLDTIDRDGLTKRWTEVFDCPAPKNCQVTLLRGALAWHDQMSQLGKSGSADVQRLLKKLQRSNTASITSDGHTPGTRLLREWQGHTHHVTVLTRGFEYNNKTYRSLTAITRQITGTPWSGPQFFGLRT